MLRQHNFAEDKKPDDWWDDPNQRDHAKRIERAFLFGAVRLTGEAFSFSPDDDDIFLTNVLDLFHGIDEEEKDIERIFEAIDVEEGAMWGGREAMIEYLLKERKDEDLRDLADQQKVCWSPVDIQDLALKTQRKLQEEFAALGINFMQLHPFIHGSILREATFAGVPLALQHFHEYSQYVAGLNATDDEKAETLLNVYREHEQAVSNAVKGHEDG